MKRPTPETATDMRDAARAAQEAQSGDKRDTARELQEAHAGQDGGEDRRDGGGYLSSPHENAAEHAITSDDNMKDFMTTDDGLVFQVLKHVNLPVISMKKDGTKILCQIITPIDVGRQLADSKRGPRMQPARICTVAALNGQRRTLVCGTVLDRELTECYPDHGYVGRWFAIERTETRTMANGSNYGVYAIAEVMVDPKKVLTMQQAARLTVEGQPRFADIPPLQAREPIDYSKVNDARR